MINTVSQNSINEIKEDNSQLFDNNRRTSLRNKTVANKKSTNHRYSMAGQFNLGIESQQYVKLPQISVKKSGNAVDRGTDLKELDELEDLKL